MEALSVDENERLALLAHEIRSSLTAIQGFGITLREHGDELRPSDRTVAIDAIVHGSEALLALADDLLASGRAEAGELRLRYEWVDIAGLARDVVETQRHMHPGIDIALSIPPALPVVGDPVTLARALDNLVRNAVRHAPRTSRIDVEGSPVLDMVAMSVRNAGEPLAPEMRARLFQKFSGSGEGGTGLGLYLTRLIVEAHGGSIWYSHEQGANWFTFLIPAQGAVARKKAERE